MGFLHSSLVKSLIIAHAKGEVSLLSTQNRSFSTSAPHLSLSDSLGNILLPSLPFSTAYFLRALGRKDLPAPGLKIPGASRLLPKVCARVSKSNGLCKNIYFFLALKGKDKFLRQKHNRKQGSKAGGRATFTEMLTGCPLTSLLDLKRQLEKPWSSQLNS